jgi:two-component system, NtrC family, sensor kinase
MGANSELRFHPQTVIQSMTHPVIRRQVLVPLTLTFLVLLGTFFYSSLRIRHINVVHELEHRYEGVRELSRELQGQRGELLETLAKVVAEKDVLRQAMADEDRAALLKNSLPVFEEFKARHGLTHLYFFTPEGQVFFRAHHPERFGDAIGRHTLRRAIASGQTSAGAELGPLGTFTLRVVYPWVVDGELLGYIELGEVLDRIVQQLKAITGVEFIVTIKKDYLDRGRWEDHRRLLGRPAHWDLLNDKAIAEMTLDKIPEGVLTALGHRAAGLQAAVSRVYLDDRTLVLRIFPLHDVSDYEIGDFLLLYDISAEMQTFNEFIWRVFAFGLLLCSGLFVFAYRVLGRTDRKLAYTQDSLRAEIVNANQINDRLEREITERRRVEEDLKILNEQLEHRVGERTAELQKLNTQIEASRQELTVAYEDLKAKQATILHQDKMACIGLLAAGVAHDINNPIGFVASNLAELQEYMPKIRRVIALQDRLLSSVDAASSLMDELEEFREKIEFDHILEDLEILVQESLEGSERVSKIVQNLRTFSRVDDSDYEAADINECLESTINITANELRYKAVVHRDYGNLPAVYCYPQQINQVFMNLLINAAHAIEERGEVRVRTWAQDDSVMIRIADTGCGIAPEEQEKIFEPFFTTKAVGKGTGLGLSITYDIISRHQGEISVESEIDRGTAFTIRLPIHGED